MHYAQSPQAQSNSKKMTKIGYDRITAEIDRLWNKERPIVVEEVYQAALLGDRSENAAYIYGKRRLREIDSRLRHLRSKIKDISVVNELTLSPRPDVVFGALVVIETTSDDGSVEERAIRLVDQSESLPKKDRISVQSPIGRALLGKKEGDTFELKLPKGLVEIEVIEIHYGAIPEDLFSLHKDSPQTQPPLD